MTSQLVHGKIASMTVRRRNIIVMGASAGGVEAYQELVAGLPADLPAALFLVLHVPA